MKLASSQSSALFLPGTKLRGFVEIVYEFGSHGCKNVSSLKMDTVRENNSGEQCGRSF